MAEQTDGMSFNSRKGAQLHTAGRNVGVVEQCELSGTCMACVGKVGYMLRMLRSFLQSINVAQHTW